MEREFASVGVHFDEAFSDDDFSNRCPFAAYKYAQVVSRAMLFHLFRHYRFSSKLRMDELRIEFNVNVRLLNNHMVSVHRRND